MIVAVAAGLLAYYRLGRNEDPSFVIKTMVVSAAWPGATMEDTLKQVTERLERQLEETPGLDFVRSYTTPGMTTIFVNLKQSVPGREVQDTWYQVRNLVDRHSPYPASRNLGSVLQRSLRRHLRHHLRLHLRRLHRAGAARPCRSGPLAAACSCPTCPRSRSSARRTSASSSSSRCRELANLGIDRTALLAALQSQNVVRPAGTIQTQDEKLSLRVSGAFEIGSRPSERQFPGRRPHGPARRYRDRAARPCRSASAACSASTARRRSASASPCATAATSWRSATTSRRRWRRSPPICPLGIEPHLVADQAVTVDHAIADFMTSLWQSVAIILVVSFISLGVRPGLVVALSIPLTLAVVFAGMDVAGIDMQRISLGALIIALALARRRRDDDDRRDGDAARRRRREDEGRDLCLQEIRDGDARRHAGHDRRFRADRFCGELGRRIHLLALRRRQHRARCLLVRGGRLRAGARRRDADGAEDRDRRCGARPAWSTGFPAASVRRDQGALDHDRGDARPVRRLGARVAAGAAPVLPGLRPARAARRPDAAAERLDLCERDSWRRASTRSQGRSGRRALEHLCRARRDPLLPAAERAAARTTSSARP